MRHVCWFDDWVAIVCHYLCPPSSLPTARVATPPWSTVPAAKDHSVPLTATQSNNERPSSPPSETKARTHTHTESIRTCSSSTYRLQCGRVWRESHQISTSSDIRVPPCGPLSPGHGRHTHRAQTIDHVEQTYT